MGGKWEDIDYSELNSDEEAESDTDVDKEPNSESAATKQDDEDNITTDDALEGEKSVDTESEQTSEEQQ